MGNGGIGDGNWGTVVFGTVVWGVVGDDGHINAMQQHRSTAKFFRLLL